MSWKEPVWVGLSLTCMVCGFLMQWENLVQRGRLFIAGSWLGGSFVSNCCGGSLNCWFGGLTVIWVPCRPGLRNDLNFSTVFRFWHWAKVWVQVFSVLLEITFWFFVLGVNFELLGREVLRCRQSFYKYSLMKTQKCRSKLGAWQGYFKCLTRSISSMGGAPTVTTTRGFLQVFVWLMNSATVWDSHTQFVNAFIVVFLGVLLSRIVFD